MKKIKNITSGILFMLLFISVSCSEYIALEYENDPALYFVNDEYGQRDSLSQSFFLIPGNGPDTVYVEIQTMGRISDSDRPFKLQQTNADEENAAVAGVHYVAFDDPQVAKYFVIPANQVKVRLPIILLRDESLNLKEVRLKLGFETNEYFHPGIDAWTSFLIKSTAQANKPTIWDTRWKYYFGASWGTVKMKFIIDATGYTEWDIFPTDFGYVTFMKTKVLSKFQEYKDANPDNPLKEADGTLVSFTS